MKKYSAFVLVLCAEIFCQIASASVISGSFSGTAVHVTGSPFDVQEGDAVTGFFSLDTSYPFELIGGDGSTRAMFEYAGRYTSPDPLPPPPMYIAINAPAASFVYDLAGDVADVTMTRDASGQGLAFLTGYGGYCCAASLTLFGESGAFFPSFDVSVLHAGEVDLDRSFASYSYKGSLNFDVAFTRFSFDTAPVPEPQSWLMLMMGLGLLMYAHVQSRRHAAVV